MVNSPDLSLVERFQAAVPTLLAGLVLVSGVALLGAAVPNLPSEAVLAERDASR